MNTRLYPEDIDCTWLGLDRNRHVGAFVTAGIGPIPIALLDLEKPEVEDMGSMVCALPNVSTARILISVPDPSYYVELAERGIFVYDWTDVHRSRVDELNSYEPFAIPNDPLTLDSLPTALKEVVTLAKFDQVTFSDRTRVDVTEYVSCRAVIKHEVLTLGPCSVRHSK
jgi:hypothetical protein